MSFLDSLKALFGSSSDQTAQEAPATDEPVAAEACPVCGDTSGTCPHATATVEETGTEEQPAVEETAPAETGGEEASEMPEQPVATE